MGIECTTRVLTASILGLNGQVPVRLDYSDVYNLLAFFDGGIDENRTGNHDDLAEEIANAGADWAKHFWRDVDMQACEFRASALLDPDPCSLTPRADVYRLMLEWARILDPAREEEHA